MTTTITALSTFSTPLTVQDGVDDADAATMLTILQPLANRDLYLNDNKFGTAGAGLTSSGVTVNVVANADGSIVVNANDVQVGVLASDAQHGARGGGTQHANAVASGAAGFMTGADKAKLDGLPSAAASPWTVTSVKTSAYTAAAYELVRVDTSAGAVTITLPTAVGNSGKPVTIKKVDAGTSNDVTIDGDGSETIDGAATNVIAAASEARGVRRLVSDGANWLAC